jgi:hypothetical protein
VAGELSLVPGLGPGVALHEVEGEVLVFDGATLSRLTGPPAAVARLVDGSRSVRAIARAAALPVEQVHEELARLSSMAVVGLMSLAPEDGYRRPDHVGACPDGDQVVLLDLRDGERHVLNPPAAAIWEALMATGSLAAAVAELAEAFPEASGVAGDTARFVTSLESQGLLERI